MRFIVLFKSLVKKRRDGGESRKNIEDEVLKREKELRQGLSMQAKRKRWEDNESEETRLLNLKKKKKLRKLFVCNVKWRGH